MSINVEAILDDLFANEINAEISWLWGSGTVGLMGGFAVVGST